MTFIHNLAYSGVPKTKIALKSVLQAKIVHKVTADALIHFFASNEKGKTPRSIRRSSDVGLELVGREDLMKRMQKKADD